MNRRLMQESKAISRKIIKDNIAKILLISLISYIPVAIGNAAVVSILPVVDITSGSVDALFEALRVQMLGQVGVVFVSLLFYPITVAASKMYLNMLFSKPANLSELFENFASISKVFSCISLYFSLFIKELIRMIPCFILFVITFFAYDGLARFMSEVILLIPFYIAIFFIMFYGIGRLMLPIIFQNICILNFNNEDFSRKDTYRSLKEIFGHRTGELAHFALSFIGVGLLAFILSMFTIAVFLLLFNIYFTLSLTFYVTKHNTQFLPNNIKSQEGHYGQ